MKKYNYLIIFSLLSIMNLLYAQDAENPNNMFDCNNGCKCYVTCFDNSDQILANIIGPLELLNNKYTSQNRIMQCSFNRNQVLKCDTTQDDINIMSQLLDREMDADSVKQLNFAQYSAECMTPPNAASNPNYNNIMFEAKQICCDNNGSKPITLVCVNNFSADE